MTVNKDRGGGKRRNAASRMTGRFARQDLPGEQVVEMRVAARPERLRLVRALLTEVAAANGCRDDCTRDIVIAVDEACQNVIRHAYGGDPEGEILLDVRREGDCLVIHVVDFAAPVDVDRIKPRPLDELKPGGLGTHFISQCMDESEFRTPPEGAGNCLRMVKKIE